MKDIEVDLTDVLQVNSPHGDFETWAVHSAAKSNLSEVSLLVEALIAAGVAKTKADALQYLSDYTADLPKHSQIFAADLQGAEYSVQLSRLRKMLKGENQSEQKVLFRLFGTLTHLFVGLMQAGLRPSYYTKQAQADYLNSIQPNLFDQAQGRQPLLPIFQGDGNLSEFRDPGYIRSLKCVWKDVQGCLSDPNLEWQQRLYKIRLHVHEIEKLLEPLIGFHMQTLFRYRAADQERSEYMAAITLIIWVATIIEQLESKDLLIFPELPVIDAKYGLGRRRIDGLVIERIGGKKPTKSQAQTLHRMILAIARNQFKIRSVGQFLRGLEEIFKSEIQAQIVDYKSAVGDFTGTTDFLVSKESCPLPKHQTQMVVYLLLAMLDKYLAEGVTSEREIWTDNPNVKQAKLLYLLPTSQPFASMVEQNRNEQESNFLSEIVMRIPNAHRTGRIRRTSNKLAVHALNLLDKKAGRKHFISAKTPLLFPKAELASPAQQIINQSRMFIDDYQIIELVKIGRDVKYMLHLQALQLKIEDDTLQTLEYSPEQGGYVECPDQSHQSPIRLCMLI